MALESLFKSIHTKTSLSSSIVFIFKGKACFLTSKSRIQESFAELNSFTSLVLLIENHVLLHAREAVNEVQVVNDSSWDELVIGSETPVLVDFWAPWCGPCRMIAPIIDELAKEYAGKIKCYKLNTDESPNTATKYGIRSIPTVLFFKNGERKDSVIGAVPKATLSEKVEKYI
nr:thioredoxin m [Pisum sativum]